MLGAVGVLRIGPGRLEPLGTQIAPHLLLRRAPVAAIVEL